MSNELKPMADANQRVDPPSGGRNGDQHFHFHDHRTFVRDEAEDGEDAEIEPLLAPWQKWCLSVISVAALLYFLPQMISLAPIAKPGEQTMAAPPEIALASNSKAPPSDLSQDQPLRAVTRSTAADDDPIAACVGHWIATAPDGSRSIQFTINGDYQSGGTYTMTEGSVSFAGAYQSPADLDDVLSFDDGDGTANYFVMRCGKRNSVELHSLKSSGDPIVWILKAT